MSEEITNDVKPKAKGRVTIQSLQEKLVIAQQNLEGYMSDLQVARFDLDRANTCISNLEAETVSLTKERNRLQEETAFLREIVRNLTSVISQ